MKLALGTVQFGLKYGIANRDGQPSLQEVRNILASASAAGIDTLDTAYHYGESEAVLGKLNTLSDRFRIVTKTLQIQGDQVTDSTVAALDQAFTQSLARLRRTAVYAVLVHNADDLLIPGGERLYQWLCSVRERGASAKIGVSVYTPEQAARMLAHYDFDLIQAPFNLLDRRIAATGLLTQLKQRSVEVHVRSAFLQGLFFISPDALPLTLASARPFIQALQQRARDLNVSIGGLALAFLRQNPQIDRIVIGVDTAAQLARNLADYATALADPHSFDGLECTELTIINPTLWKTP
jgi:aryl-alcohol dehydrogenase-like predicted oxidoreductase